MNKKGSIGLWGTLILLIVILFIAVVGIKYYSGRPLSFGGDCQDWTPIPGVSCSSDDACLQAVTHGVTPDAGTFFRCNAGACETKFTICSVRMPQ